MNIRVKRIALKERYTIGKMYLDGVYFCDTLEDKVRDTNKNGVFDKGEKKVYAETAIPYGTYKVILSMSNRFKRLLPEVLSVPEFTGVRIHAGNYGDYVKVLYKIPINKNNKQFIKDKYIEVV